jgi:site-specific recombinase XerD
MKPFESFLAQQMEEFLTYRESLGYRVKNDKTALHTFDRYLVENNGDSKMLEPAFFLEMRANLKMGPSSINAILSTTRTFFQFLVRRGCYRKNPLQDIPQLKKHAIVPFVFSPKQTDQLLEAMCKRFHKTRGMFLKDLAIYTVLLLLARCGMRITEPLRLKRHHYRRDEASIYIARTKFAKDRLISIPKEVATQIENYLSVRKSLIRHDQSPFLLIQANQCPLSDFQVRRLFHILLRDIGLEQPRRVVGKVNFLQPTPHSLRHSFAVGTLLKIKERGGSPQTALPILAAYMGHSEYKYTSVYLRVTDAMSRKQLVDFSLWQEGKQ